MAININTFHPIEDTSKTIQTNFSQPNRVASRISQLVDPLFNKIKELSTKHLGSPTYLLINQEDIAAKKIAKVSSWLLGISPTILLGAYVYDHLADLYHQHFENYSRMEEYSDEFSENFESLEVQLPTEQRAKIESLPEYTIPKTLEPSFSIHVDDDISDTTSEADVDSNLGESDFESLSEEKITTDDDSREISATPFDSQESSVDISIIEHSRENDDNISNATPDSLEDSFEQIDALTPELLEEMKHSPQMPSSSGGVVNRIIEIGRGIKAFWANNPFTSKKPHITNTIASKTEYKEPSYEDLKMLHPIVETYTNPKIGTIAENIAQIKVDLPRMEIFANGIHCANIQDFMNSLGLTLDEDETEVSPSDNAIIPKILDLSQQRSLNFSHGVLAKHWQNMNVIPMMAHIEGKRPTVHVNWNAKSPEQCEITGETFFRILSVNDSTFLPYLCKVKIKHSLDKAEVSWEILEEPSSETVANSQNVQEIEHPKPTSASSDDGFEILEEDFEDKENAISDYDRALDHLLNKPNVCLNSTVTLEYLKSLETRYPNFVYTDQLMLPISITTDEIVDSLNRLKNDKPANQTIFLPFLVEGWTNVDHAVVAVVNPANETIEYFDPKGQSSIRSRRVKNQSNKNVFDFLTELGQKFISPTFSKEKIVYNKKNTPQGFSDNINCGAFCLQFIEERITRPFDAIENDLAIDPKQLRLQLANRLIQNTHSN